MTTGKTFDAEGVVKAWAQSLGITGKGKPVAAGIHLGRPRSPQAGAIAGLSVGSSTVDSEGLGHRAGITFEVKAVGGQAGARKQALEGATAIAVECRELTGAPVPVEYDGMTVWIRYCENVQGPLFAGDVGGEITYRVSTVFVLSDVP
ncbi:hypothetical protein [Kineosporia sp. NBRC 101731]|uniref:hypothetical protein n=1 Tax=Kineosporia sp. NBRC 101731 TaxID=3032199 RepID=UPI00249FE549|nr:hypothetical protein [Kineosporia sp. NBRC 101731]GLY32133.1 hypothetical protein Kisp02_54980 [Kineosporia sp. NBRC 101731]